MYLNDDLPPFDFFHLLIVIRLTDRWWGQGESNGFEVNSSSSFAHLRARAITFRGISTPRKSYEQYKPLNVITLGRIQSDNNNVII